MFVYSMLGSSPAQQLPHPWDNWSRCSRPPPQSSSGPRSHGLPASSLLFLPHPALRQPDLTYLLGLVAPGMTGGLGGAASRCSALLQQMGAAGGGGHVRRVCVASRRALSLQDLSGARMKPCVKGPGGADPAEQCGLPAPAGPWAHWVSRQLGLLTSSCAGLHFNPPSCLISKSDSLTDRLVGCGCLGGALWPCYLPCKSEAGAATRVLI